MPLHIEKVSPPLRHRRSARRHRARHRRRRDRRADRPVGLRQVDLARHPGRPAAAQRRPRHAVGPAASRIRSTPSPTSSRISPCCPGAASPTMSAWRWSIARSAPPSAASASPSALALTGLGEFATAYPKQLSGGMRQRVGIARALVVRPAVLLLDEPLSALDAQTRELLMEDLLAIWAREKSTRVYVTHNLEEAARLADRVVVLSRRPGRIREIVAHRRAGRRARASRACRPAVRGASPAVVADPRRGRHRRPRDPAPSRPVIIARRRASALDKQSVLYRFCLQLSDARGRSAWTPLMRCC